MSVPLFSIVTVTLNCAEAAVQTARSVLSQNYAGYEYIVKDGGSTDSTVERLRDLGVTVHVSQDRGIYDAMNQAIELCRGDYIYFLNANDTFYETTTLEKVVHTLDPSSAIVYGDIFILPICLTQHHPQHPSRYYLFRKNLNHQACFVRRETYSSLGGFDLRFRFNADQYLLRRAILQHNAPTQHLNLVISKWQHGGFSTCASNTNAVMRERWIMLKEFYKPYELIIYGVMGLYFANRAKMYLWNLKYRRVIG